MARRSLFDQQQEEDKTELLESERRAQEGREEMKSKIDREMDRRILVGQQEIEDTFVFDKSKS